MLLVLLRKRFSFFTGKTHDYVTMYFPPFLMNNGILILIQRQNASLLDPPTVENSRTMKYKHTCIFSGKCSGGAPGLTSGGAVP